MSKNIREAPLSDKTCTILLVEDNHDHIELIRRAITIGPLKADIYISTDGEDALNFVFKTGKYKKAKRVPTPDLILLDIKLPKVDGYNVLQSIRAHTAYRSIPIIILTTSAREEDIERMLQYGADSYIIKPSQYHEFVAIYEKIENYWKQHIAT